MLTLTTTGSTAGRSVVNDCADRRAEGSGDAAPRRRGPPVRQPHGLAVLVAVDGLGAKRSLTAFAPAQFAQHTAAVVDMHPLTDERCSMAAVAVVAPGREGHDATTQQLAFQLRCMMSGLHRSYSVRRTTRGSSLLSRVCPQAVRTRTGPSRFGAEADWVVISPGRPRGQASSAAPGKLVTSVTCAVAPHSRQRTEVGDMESHTSGTLVGTGTFRCVSCEYVVSLAAADTLPPCPSCGGEAFVRASLFTAANVPAPSLPNATAADETRLADIRAEIDEPGQYLVYEDGEESVIHELTREWTRIGRSLAADVRFDDPTVSRRHALVVRQPDGVRVLDDRSLNGVFVNGERIEWHPLRDGDELVVGRHRLSFVDVPATTDSER